MIKKNIVDTGTTPKTASDANKFVDNLVKSAGGKFRKKPQGDEGDHEINRTSKNDQRSKDCAG